MAKGFGSLAPESTVLGLRLGCGYRAWASGLVNLSVADVGSLPTHTDLSALDKIIVERGRSKIKVQGNALKPHFSLMWKTPVGQHPSAEYPCTPYRVRPHCAAFGPRLCKPETFRDAATLPHQFLPVWGGGHLGPFINNQRPKQHQSLTGIFSPQSLSIKFMLLIHYCDKILHLIHGDRF